MGLLLLSLWWNAVTAGHDFHYSRTDVVYDPASRSWQVTLRVFTDDFEAELEARSPAGGPMRLGDSRQRADAAAVAAEWAQNGLQMYAGTKRVPLRWVGMDVAHDLTYLFLETAPGATGRAQELRIRNTLFFSRFSDQINEVNLRHSTTDLRRALDASRPEESFRFR
jgi:hypothetical protein